jgi:hypothetical protein
MNKKYIYGGIAVLGVMVTAGWNVSLGTKGNDLSVASLNQVEALAQETTTGNTGPAEVVDCAGWGTGSKKVCLCTNTYNCTESSCS